jgi:hypothetical protein
MPTKKKETSYDRLNKIIKKHQRENKTIKIKSSPTNYTDSNGLSGQHYLKH